MQRRLFSNFFWWILLGLLWMLAIFLGVAGWMQYNTLHHLTFDFFDDLYLTAQLISLGSGVVEQPVPLFLNIARFAFPFLTLLTAVKAFLDVFREQIRAIRMQYLRDHIIICGLSRKGMLLASQFRQQGDKVVVIEQDEDNPWLESCRGMGVFILVGDASDPTILTMAGVVQARGLIAVCDNDGINADIVIQVQMLARKRNPGRFDQPLVALAHITDPRLCDLLRLQESKQDGQNFRMELFNVFERAAIQLLKEYPAWNKDQVRAGHEPHILLIGLGRMGENIITHAAENWHSVRPAVAKRLHITVIDRYALRKVESLDVRHPQLAQDCLFTPLQMEVRSPEFERGAFLVNERGEQIMDRVYVCVDDDALGLHAGLTIQRCAQADRDLMIVVRMAEENGLAKLLEDRKKRKGIYKNLVAFGYLNHTCTPELLRLSSTGSNA